MKKITSSHTTYIEASEKLLKFLNEEISVRKIVLGKIVVKSKPSKTITPIKIVEHTGCLLLKVNSKQSHQEIRVYSEECQILKQKLDKEFETLS